MYMLSKMCEIIKVRPSCFRSTCLRHGKGSGSTILCYIQRGWCSTWILSFLKFPWCPLPTKLHPHRIKKRDIYSLFIQRNLLLQYFQYINQINKTVGNQRNIGHKEEKLFSVCANFVLRNTVLRFVVLFRKMIATCIKHILGLNELLLN